VAAGAAATVVTARLALDEMLSPQIASELMRRGHDVVAVAADPGLAGLPDEQILEWATEQRRCLVTENVKDDEVLRRASAAQGRTHAGLLYCGPRRFPRDRRFLGALVVALDKLIAAGQLPGPDEVGWLAP
jgi:predicted nuclease of predicted toxin-antitoxin system